MVEAAMGKLVCGDAQSARRTLFYLKCTQEKDGNWTQNMWLDGTPKWTNTQMDGTAFCIILADALRRVNQLEDANPWPMIQKSAGFLVRNGPVTQQDRWEENPGYSPYTMAVQIAALLAAADFAEQRQNGKLAEFLRVTADAWNDSIDEWTYVSGSDLARAHGVTGYYVRITPPEVVHASSIRNVSIGIKNRPEPESRMAAIDVVSPDALALVRFGVRAADDPRMTDTVRVIDATLKKNLCNGPVWHRYTNDGYGEQADGSPFAHRGQGRGWPLLTGERAHYEIARGNFHEADLLLKTIQAQTSECGLIPEQVWDCDDIPARELYNGRPTGSGMPLVWAHAEYVKLLRSLKELRVWDTPPQPVQRYQVQKKVSRFGIWTFEQPRTRIGSGKDLRVDVRAPARVHWSTDNWKTAQEITTTDSGLGVHWALLDVAQCKPGENVQFTFLWLESNSWEGSNFTVSVT
jgi:glucoamylase